MPIAARGSVPALRGLIDLGAALAWRPLTHARLQKSSDSMTERCPPLDRAIEKRELEVLRSEQLEFSISVFEVVSQLSEQIDARCKLRL